MMWLFLLFSLSTLLSAADYVPVNNNQPTVDTDKAVCLKYTMACTLGGLVGLGHVTCNIILPHYCVHNPIPGSNTGIWMNVTIVPWLITAIGVAAGWGLGKTLAYCCLRNHGKETIAELLSEESA